MVKEVQQAMMREYVMAGIARILDDNMHDFDTIAVHNNHFVLVLPEIPAEEAAQIAQKLEDAVKEQMKIRLQVGTATFPNEAMTFERLVELAIEKAQKSSGVLSAPKQINRQNLGDVRL
jgi:GGDEF domain-containing protein